MPVLHVHRSHRTEALAERLARLWAQPLDDPMQPERVLVGSRGMERWLATWLVQQSARGGGPGVVANVVVDFPARFVDRLVDEVLGPRPTGVVDPWSADALVWTLAGRIPDAIEQHPAAFADIARYLQLDVTTAVPVLTAGDAGAAGDGPTQLALEVSLDTGAAGLVVDRRLLGFATSTADLFDRYALFRPAMVRAWRDGADVDGDGRPLGPQRWQALLWRTVAGQQADAPSPADRIAAACAALDGGHRLGDEVPARLVAFGVSTLPPLHLELLAAVARQRDVHLFVPSPSPRLWALGWTGDDSDQPANPLLRAAGPVGRHAAALVAAAVERDGPDPVPVAGVGADEVLDTAPVDPGSGPTPTTLLARLQHDVVLDAAPPATPMALVDGDRSVVFHDGHGAVRQVEALHDELLRRFAEDDTLHPRDVVVLTPDTRTYAPLVEAVFADPLGRWPDGRPRGDDPPTIPVAVADRRTGGGNPVAAVLRRALALVHARTSGAEVLDLLATEPVRARFQLTPTELLTVQRWIEDTGVAWARDERDRDFFGQPARRAHTWAAARDRLLLGVAMADERHRTVGGVVPYDGVEDSGDLDLLDRFTRFLDVVDELADLRDPRGAGAWAEDLGGLLDRLTGPAEGPRWLDDEARALHQRHRARVDRVLAALTRVDEALARDVEVRALARWLDGALDAVGGAAGHGTGAVTVAELVPLRAIPHRVVCLLGLDTDRFPRGSTPPGHDLVARQPRPGDRDRRAEDRALFLDALHAARDALVVTYAGRDPVTGREQPPAIPVAELRDAVAATAGRDALATLTTVHPVLPTGAASFDAADPTSFDQVRLDAAEAARGRRVPTPPFVADPLPADDVLVGDVVSLDQLTRRLAKPAQALLDHLRIARPEDLRTFPETEPLELDALQRWQLGTDLLTAVAASAAPDVDALVDTALARGPTPAGGVGRFAVRGVQRVVDRMQSCLEALGPRADVAITLDVGGRRLEGTVVVAAGDRRQLVETWYGRADGKRHLRLWLRHLAATVALDDAALRTVVLHRDEDEVAAAVHPPLPAADAATELGRWLDWFDRCRTERMPFVAKVSWVYAEARREAERLAASVDGVDLADVEGLDDAELRHRHGATTSGGRSVRDVLDRGLARAHGAWGRGEDDRGFPARADDDVAIVFRDVHRWEDLVASTPLLPLARTLLRPVVDSLRLGEAEAAEVCR